MRYKIGILLLLTSCSSHSHHKHKGIAGEPLDIVVKQIQENNGCADTFGQNKTETFEVYMIPLPDEQGNLSDEGIVQISGNNY